MAWLTPKTDWTDADRYNYEDINRVESNSEHVKDYLMSIGYSVPSITFITSRTQESVDLLSSINRLESNFQTIWQAFIYSEGWTLFVWAESTSFGADTANRWERDMERIYLYAQSAYESFRYCGTFSSGQEEYLI